MKMILFTITSKTIKHFGIKFTKKYKTYTENCKILLKEIKENLNK